MIHITHRFQMRDGIAQVVLYCYTPIEYEFATDFNEIHNNAINTANGIRDYIQKNFSHIQNQTAMIIVNGVVLGSTAISNILTNIGNKKSE